MYTRKQIKSVLTEWKSFLKEANEGASENIVFVYDFDGTLVNVDADPVFKQAAAYYVPFLRKYAYAKFLELVKEKAVALPLLDQIKNQTDYSNTYIVSQINSSGFTADKEDSFVQFLLSKDSKMTAFLSTIVGIDAGTEDKDKSEKSDESLYIKATHDETSEEAANAARTLIRKYFRFHLSSAEAKSDDDSIDVAYMQDRKKNMIRSILKNNGINFPINHIVMCSNLAQSSTGTTSGIKKGSSGKFQPGVLIGSKHKDALFKIFDNQSAGLAQFKKGLLSGISANNPLVNQIDVLNQELASAVQEKDKAKEKDIQSKLKIANDELNQSVNAETYAVEKDGSVKQLYAPSLKKDTGGQTVELDFNRQWQQIRNYVYQQLLQGSKITTLGNMKYIDQIVSNVSNPKPELATVIDSLVKNPTSNMKIKKLSDLALKTAMDITKLDEKDKRELSSKVNKQVEEFKKEWNDIQSGLSQPATEPQQTTSEPESEIAAAQMHDSLNKLAESVRPQKKLLREFKLVLKLKK